DLLHRADPAREDDDAVAEADERLQALLDIRHDHELVDDGIRRLGRNDAGLRQTDIAAGLDALLGVADVGALHGAFHGARTAAGADVEAAQAEFIPYALGVVVLLAADGMAAPADDEIRVALRAEHLRIAQD